jgi:hypothetical protein
VARGRSFEERRPPWVVAPIATKLVPRIVAPARVGTNAIGKTMTAISAGRRPEVVEDSAGALGVFGSLLSSTELPVRTVLQRGPKGKKAVAFAIDWPGWSRGAKTPAEALATLDSYRRRYRPVALAAGMGDEFDAAGPLEVIQEQVSTGSTDFWGISFSPSDTEQDPMSDTEFDRKINLLRACWALFDMVAVRVSPDMRKGPRGGGRDRDTIISHTIRTESENFAKRVGLRTPEGGALTTDGLVAHREAYVAAMRAYNSGEGKRMRSWTLPFLIRHSAFHVMDHAWEMEDKDVPGEAQA